MQCELVYSNRGEVVPSKLVDDLRALLQTEYQVDEVYSQIFTEKFADRTKDMPRDEHGQPTLEAVLKSQDDPLHRSPLNLEASRMLVDRRFSTNDIQTSIKNLRVSTGIKTWLGKLYSAPNLKVVFVSDSSILGLPDVTTPETSNVGPGANGKYRIVINLNEALYDSKEFNIPVDNVIAYILLHEVNHLYFNSEALARVGQLDSANALFEEVKRQWRKDPPKIHLNSGRALANIEEFLTESVSNPNFIKWLKAVKMTGNKNALTRLWEILTGWLSDLFGISRPSGVVQVHEKLYSMYDLVFKLPTLTLPGKQYLSETVASDEDPFFQELTTLGNEVVEDEANNNYVDAKDSSNVFKRVSDYAKGVMSLFKRKPKVGPSGAEWEAASIWGAKFVDGKWDYSISKDTPMLTNISKTPVTWDEYVSLKEGYFDQYSQKGKLIHKLIAMAFSGRYSKEEIDREYTETVKQYGINQYLVNWLMAVDQDGKRTMFKAIADKLGLNIYEENLSKEQRDKLLHEITIFNRTLGWAGRADLLVKHVDGFFSLFDFKSAADMDRAFSSHILKYGRMGQVVTENKRDLAHLQLAIYAVLLKLQNPEMQFRKVSIAHVADQRTAKTVRPQDEVPVATFIPMIEAFLRNEMPEEYAKLKESLGDKFSKVWDPKEYSVGYSNSLTKELTDGTTPSQLYYMKSKELRMMLQYTTDDKEIMFSNSAEMERRRDYIKKTLHEIINLKKAGGIDETTWKEDLSWMSHWIGSMPDIANPYVRVFHEVLEEAMQNAGKEIQAKMASHTKYFKPVWEQYKNRREDWKKALAAVSFEKINFSKYSDVFDFLYKDVVNAAGETIRKDLNITDEDFAAWEATHGRKVTKEERAYAAFLHGEFKFFLTDPNSYYNQNVGSIVNPITGMVQDATPLMLYNGIENPKTEKFQYWEGWFPRFEITQEEVLAKHSVFSKGWANDLWRRSFTHYFENQFDRWNSSPEESIPIKGLGTNMINVGQNHTLNMEQAFGRFVSSYYHKKYGDEVYAMGRAIKLFVEMKTNSKDLPNMSNLVSFIDKQMNMVLLGRTQKEFPGRFTRTRFVNDDGEEFSWVKFLQSLKGWASSTIMWIKPITGLKNGVFLLMTTVKESLLKEIMTGRERLPYKDFGVKELAQGSKDFFGLQKDAAANQLYKNKAWLIAKQLRYLPDHNIMRATYRDTLSERNRFFDRGNLYIFHSFWEEWASISTMSAQLRSTKYKMKDGSMKSLWDLYSVVEKDGEFTLEWAKDVDGKPVARGFVDKSSDPKRPDIQPLTEITAEEAISMKYVYQRMMGGYRPEERTALEYYVFGQLFLQMRKYLPNIIKSALMSKGTRGMGQYQPTGRFSESGQPMYEWVARMMEGRWLVFGKMLAAELGAKGKANIPAQSWVGQYIGKNLSNLENYRWKELSIQDKESMFDMGLTWAFLAMMFLGYSSLFDDEEKEDPLRKLMWRMMADFSQQVNPIEVFKLVADTKPASIKVISRFILGMSQAVPAAMFYTLGNEEKALTQKGYLRGSLEVLNTLPVSSQLMDIIRFGQGYDSPYFEDFLKLHGNDSWRP